MTLIPYRAGLLVAGVVLALATPSQAQLIALARTGQQAGIYVYDVAADTTQVVYRDRQLIDIDADPRTGDVYAYDAARRELLVLHPDGDLDAARPQIPAVRDLSVGDAGGVYLGNALRELYRVDPSDGSAERIVGPPFAGGAVLEVADRIVYRSTRLDLVSLPRTNAGRIDTLASSLVGELLAGGATPDGERLVYLVTNGGPRTGPGVQRVRLDGTTTQPEVLVEGDGYRTGDLSPDGRRLWYTAELADRLRLESVDLATGEIRFEDAWRPPLRFAFVDAQRLAVFSQEGEGHLALQSLADSSFAYALPRTVFNPRQLRYDSLARRFTWLNGASSRVDDRFASLASVQRDTQVARLILVADDTLAPASYAPLPGDDLLVGTLDSGLYRVPRADGRLTRNYPHQPLPGRVPALASSADGSRIIFSDERTGTLRVMDAVGQDGSRVVWSGARGGVREVDLPAASPDTAVLLLDGGTELAVLDLTRGDTVRLWENPGPFDLISAVATHPTFPGRVYGILRDRSTYRLYLHDYRDELGGVVATLPFPASALAVLGRGTVSSVRSAPAAAPILRVLGRPGSDRRVLRAPAELQSLRVLDAAGRTVFAQTRLEQPECALEVDDWAPGLYLGQARIAGNAQPATFRLVVP